ncbi:histone H3 (Lys9) methyltransferase SUV39H1/Clr4, required for transcriptional silencing [Handroanthus impetiginosus]|uniref:Histone H3 (Lys9) methyltransferase SUV39H1/Clr4, required for transcriptional silencing n=1 Tax=Handroanthus impetiginosus TaxID=429701 RepID=A0A2G9HT53_9LAMI|nr:histone H3 (Lys9) methyltransferase SUV39H1/Clr4, required for transcriptional silencing [Handroanthus impetiginosus]
MEEKHYEKTRDRRSDAGFFRCAAIVIPYLNPAELAAISCTSKSLYQISKTITSRRTSDASRGSENLPIPFLNPISDDSQPYSYFFYTPTQTLRLRPDFRQAWGSNDQSRLCRKEGRPDPFLLRVEGASGCECASCNGDCCPCLEADEFLLTRECGPSCKCGLGCGNRVTQGGVTVRLKMVKDEKKGWGLYAAEFIPRGQFVCEYAGELLSTKEATRRQQTYDKLASITPALLVVKEHLPSGNKCMRINIDATRIGNIARFVNHSCDGGNLDTVIVRSSGALLPRICFFASRDIQENEELTFSYGDIRLRPNGQPCFCGTATCAGILPSENT